MPITTFKTYTFDVSQNTTERQDFEIPTNVAAISGFQISSDRDDLLYQRCAVGIDVSNTEIAPDGTPTRMYMSGLGVPPNQKTYKIGRFPIESTNRRMRLSIADEDVAGTTYASYKLKLTIEVELI